MSKIEVSTNFSKMLLFVLLSVLMTNLYAQENPFYVKVELNDSNVVQGQLVEMVPKEFIIIKTEGDHLNKYSFDRVAKVTFIEAPSSKAKKSTGNEFGKKYLSFRNKLDKIVFHVSHVYIEGYQAGMGYGFETQVGYKVLSGLELSLGVGYNRIDTFNLRPVFAELRYYPFDKKLSPFISATYGVSKITANSPSSSFTKGFNYNYSANLGVSYQVIKGFALSFAVGYKYQNITSDWADKYLDFEKHTQYYSLDIRRIVVTVGATF